MIAGYRVEEKRYHIEAAYRESIRADDEYFRTLKKRPDPVEYFGKVTPEYLEYKKGIGDLIDTLKIRLRETKAQVSSLEQEIQTQRKRALWSGAALGILAGIFTVTSRGFSRQLESKIESEQA